MEIEFAMKIKWAVMILSLVGLGILLAEAKRERVLHIRLYVLMGVCYPLGKLIQYWFWIPQIFRFYLSDFGFVPFLGFVFFQWYRHRCPSQVRTWPQYLQTLAYATRYALVLAMLVELAQIWANRLVAPSADLMIFRGDPMDGIVYVAAYLICEYVLIGRLERVVWEVLKNNSRKKH